MAADHNLWIQKAEEVSLAKGSLAAFGFALSEMAWPTEEVAEVASREWPGEDGEDAYIPSGGLKLKAYDLDVEFVYKGEIGTAYNAYKTFRNYLTGRDGGGADLTIYDPTWDRGKKGVYVKKISDLSTFRTNLDEGASCKMTFRVRNPGSEVAPFRNAVGDVISLKEI